MSGLVNLVQSGAPDEQILAALIEVAQIKDCPIELEPLFDQLVKVRDFDKKIRLSREGTTPNEKIVILANTLLKTLQTAEERIPEDVKCCLGYHGKAISEGTNLVRSRLATHTDAMVNLANFVLGYVDRALFFPNQYLIRSSSSYEQEGNTQYFTLSWRDPTGIRQARLQRVATAYNQALWTFREQTHATPGELIGNILPDFSPAIPLSERSFNAYVDSYILSNQPQAEAWTAETLVDLLSIPSRFADPVLAPDGNTFSRGHLAPWLDAHPENKLGTSDMLRPNHLVKQIIEKHAGPFRDLRAWQESMLNLLRDPLTGEVLRDPVTAPDGLTYSRASIQGLPYASDDFIDNQLISTLLNIHLT